MTIHEKLDRLTRLHNRAALSRAAGLSHTYLSTVINRKSSTSIKAAKALAKELDVDAGWLMDDARSWPPVRPMATEPSLVA